MSNFAQSVRAIKLLAILVLTIVPISACSVLETPEEADTTTYSGPPVVTIASPLTNDSYQEGVGVNILVRVENAGPDVARVAIQIDGQIIGEAPLPNPSGAPSFTVRNGWPASGVGQHTITVTASRADGSVSAPASVVINVVAAPVTEDTTADMQQDMQPTQDTSGGIIPTQAPAPTEITQDTQTEPTNPPAPTTPPEPTAVPQQEENTPQPPPPTATSSRPQVRVLQGANVRSGPGTNFTPPVGSLAASATADALAVSTDGQWFKIRYYNGEAWIFASTVERIGDFSTLPRDAGPPTPVVVTNTPIPPTPVPSNIDLVISSSTTSPFPLECGRSSEIKITVTNNGTENSGETTVVAEDLFNGQIIATTHAPIGVLTPGQSASVTLYLTISTNVLEDHVHRIRLDPDGRVAESNEGNNTEEYIYPLQQGAC